MLNLPTNLQYSYVIREVRQTNWTRTLPSGPYPGGAYLVQGYQGGPFTEVNFGNKK